MLGSNMAPPKTIVGATMIRYWHVYTGSFNTEKLSWVKKNEIYY